MHDTLCDPFIYGLWMCWVMHVSASFLIWVAFVGWPCAKIPPLLTNKKVAPEAGKTTMKQPGDDGETGALDPIAPVQPGAPAIAAEAEAPAPAEESPAAEVETQEAPADE